MPDIGDLPGFDDEEAIKDLLGEMTSAGSIGPDGLPIPPQMPVGSSGILPATEETFVCLKGPCLHYAELEVSGDFGNSDATDHHVIRRYCKRLAVGSELMELTDGNIFKCSLHEVARDHLTEKLVSIRQTLKTLLKELEEE